MGKGGPKSNKGVWEPKGGPQGELGGNTGGVPHLEGPWDHLWDVGGQKEKAQGREKPLFGIGEGENFFPPFQLGKLGFGLLGGIGLPLEKELERPGVPKGRFLWAQFQFPWGWLGGGGFKTV